MALFLGLDVGTTTLSTVIWDAETGQLVARSTLAHAADATSPDDKARGRAELDLCKLRTLIVRALAQTVLQVQDRAHHVRAIGVTGQMHGVALLGPDTMPLAHAITWQDRRTLEPSPDRDGTVLGRFLEEAGGPAVFERMGCLPAAGYLGPSLFWLRLHDQLPLSPAVACFIPDAAVSFLTGQPPCTDPTDGGSSGLFDIVSRQWDGDLIARLGLPAALFPPVRESGAVAGELLPSVASTVGLPAGTPVCVALGDNQASFLGSVRTPDSSLLINVGTGSQISALATRFHRLEGLDTRYFPGGRYLLVGAGLFGGRSYAYLRAFFRQVGNAFFGGSADGPHPADTLQPSDEELYETMNRLAASVPSGSEGLICQPLFTGTRLDPTLRASFGGITPENFTPGHLTRALLEGVAEGFHTFYRQMQPLLGARTQLVGSGNGIRRNPLLAEILAQRFSMPLHMPALEEEAATGAAWLAATRTGAFRSPEVTRYPGSASPSPSA